MKKSTLLILIIALITSFSIKAQVSINTDGTDPDASAILDLKSSNKGMLVPRMSLAEIELITSPANGLIVFNNTDNKFYAFVSAADNWKEILYGTGTITPPWVCGDAFVDARDSQSYTTVQIGTQCWMAQNLNIGTMINSTSGGTNSDGEQTDNSTTEKYCYDNNTSNCDTYGGMYQWAEMVQYMNGATNTTSWDPVPTVNVQGICPDGWYLPTDDGWKTMEMALGMSQSQADTVFFRGTDEGKKMKSISGWGNNGNGTNSSGFNALPGGSRASFGSFYTLGYNGHWWSSSEYSGADAWRRNLFYSSDQVNRTHNSDKTTGLSVRCLKN